MKNLFSRIATTGAVLLGTSGILGCRSTGQEKYEFDGLIGGEWVKFISANSIRDINNVLMIRGNDGINREYRDNFNNDLKIENFSVDSPCEYTQHSVYRKCGLEPLAEEQAEFEKYLGKILNVKDSLSRAEEKI